MDSELDWRPMQERYGAQASESEGGVPQAEDVTVRGAGEPVPGGADGRLGTANGWRFLHEWDMPLETGMRMTCTLGEWRTVQRVRHVY